MSSVELLSATDPGGFNVFCVNRTSLPTLMQWLSAQRFGRVSVDATQITDKLSFLRALGNAFQADGLPAGSEWTNWDSAADDAWQYLTQQPHSHFALLILNADLFIHGNFQLLLQAAEFLIELGDSTETHQPHPVRLRTILVGDGPQFPILPADRA